jgi:hypothetical protein
MSAFDPLQTLESDATNVAMMRDGEGSIGFKRWSLALFGLVLASCDLGPSNPDTVMYVRVPPQEAQRFTAMLATILQSEGLSASVGRTVDPYPATNHILEGTSLRVRVWAQNAVLDPEEGKACGHSTSPVEQTQYVVSVQRRNPLSEGRARQIFSSLKAKFAERGYTVEAHQMPCQPLPRQGVR